MFDALYPKRIFQESDRELKNLLDNYKKTHDITQIESDRIKKLCLANKGNTRALGWTLAAVIQVPFLSELL